MANWKECTLSNIAIMQLRDLAEDPTYMREVLYSNMLQAAGVGTPNVIHVRVYVNRVPMGLFALTDYTKIGSLQNIWEVRGIVRNYNLNSLKIHVIPELCG